MAARHCLLRKREELRCAIFSKMFQVNAQEPRLSGFGEWLS